mmetsp:Transcript_21563/g.42846  ORF Transcript_21563/g.42846 Transcript_21563/m.42846 type:complete len:200 (-) Transcript_21563:675-1274(-)
MPLSKGVHGSSSPQIARRGREGGRRGRISSGEGPASARKVFRNTVRAPLSSAGCSRMFASSSVTLPLSPYRSARVLLRFSGFRVLSKNKLPRKSDKITVLKNHQIPFCHQFSSESRTLVSPPDALNITPAAILSPRASAVMRVRRPPIELPAITHLFSGSLCVLLIVSMKSRIWSLQSSKQILMSSGLSEAPKPRRSIA